MPKGIKGFQKGNKSKLGIKQSEETKAKISASQKMHPQHPNSGFRKGNKYGGTPPVRIGHENGNWIGDEVGYSGLHKWVAYYLGKPSCCAICHSTDKKIYQWANISHAYKRELSDWVRLCVKCHSAYDRGKIKLDI